jgi:hypothetical protein
MLPPDDEACIVFTTYAMVTMNTDTSGGRRPVSYNGVVVHGTMQDASVYSLLCVLCCRALKTKASWRR